MRVAGYIRVSTSEQSESGFSLASQERAIRRWCEDRGLAEPVLRIDAGVSAYTDDMEKRPAFAALMADVAAGQFDTVLVARLDRWARSNFVAVQQLRHLYAHGCTLVSLAEGHDFSTAAGRFVFQLMSSVAELESSMISARVRAGIAQKKLGGGYHGQLPFGARFGPDGRLEINPAREDALALLLQLSVTRGPQLVAAELTARGIPTQRGLEAWQPISAYSVVKKGAWLLDQPEPWPTLYRAARNRPPLSRTVRDRNTNLLTGLMRCGCGGVLVYSSTTRKPNNLRYVECRNYTRERPNGVRCPYKKTHVDHYEAIVTDAFLGIPELHEAPEDPSVAEARIRIAERRERVKETYIDKGDKAARDAHLAALDAEEARLPVALPLGAAMIADVAEAQATWPLMDTAERNAALRLAYSKVVITGRDVQIVPTPVLARLLESSGYDAARLRA